MLTPKRSLSEIINRYVFQMVQTWGTFYSKTSFLEKLIIILKIVIMTNNDYHRTSEVYTELTLIEIY